MQLILDLLQVFFESTFFWVFIGGAVFIGMMAYFKIKKDIGFSEYSANVGKALLNFFLAVFTAKKV